MMVLSGVIGLELGEEREWEFEHRAEIEFGKTVLDALKVFNTIDISPEDDVFINGVHIQHAHKQS